jgi:hypothetical protein
MLRVAVLTCLLGISAIVLGACASQSRYAPYGSSSSGPYDEGNPLTLHGNYD